MASRHDALLARLARRQQAQTAALSNRAAVALAAGFGRLGAVDDDALDRWLAAAVPLAATMASAAVTATFGFGITFANLANTKVGELPAVGGIVAALHGGTPAAEVWARPMTMARYMLGNGAEFTDAMASGAAKAAALGRTDVGSAARAGAAASREATEGCTGYVRVPGGGACEFCTLLATETHPVDEVTPAHANCTCAEAPVIGDNDPGVVTRDDALGSLDLSETEAADAVDAMDVVDTETGPSTP